MTEDQTRTLLALMIILGFFVLMIVVLTGFVDVTDPSIAKLVGALFGYITALMNPIIARYFKETPQ